MATAPVPSNPATQPPPTQSTHPQPQKPSDPIAGSPLLPPPSPEAAKSKSLRPLFDTLTTSNQLDSLLEDLQLSKEETEALLKTQQFRTHRQLRTELLAQQLQLAAQDHASYALQRLLDLSNSHHPAIARLAATQILSYAGLQPPSQSQPSLLRQLVPLPSPSSPPIESLRPTSPPTTPPPAPEPPRTKNPFRLPFLSTLFATLLLLNGLSNGFPSGKMGFYTTIANTKFAFLKVFPDGWHSDLGGRWDDHATSNVGETAFGGIAPSTSGLKVSFYAGTRRPIILKGLNLNKFQATFSYSGLSGVPYNATAFVFNYKNLQNYAYIGIPHFIFASGLEGYEVNSGQLPSVISATGTAPAAMADTDIIWSRVTNDGTTVTVKCLINPAGTPSDSDWSSATTYYTSTAFSGTGGQFGFIPQGTGTIGNVTIKSYNTSTSSWVTEAEESFTADSSGYVTNTLAYDNNGNLTYDGLQSYTYDAWNRLKTVAHAYRDSGGTLHSGQVFQTTSYDASGRRIVKAISGTGSLDCTYHYYLSGNRLIEERNGSDQSIKDHVWGLIYIDEAIQTRINTDPTGTATWSSYWLMQDANYNVLGLVDSSGILQERYEYSAYGQRQTFYSPGSNDPGCYAPNPSSQRVICAGSIIQPYGLCEVGHQGLLHDENVRLVHIRARMLNTEMGVFMQNDPLGYWRLRRAVTPITPSSLNRYICDNVNPVNYLDSLGLAPDENLSIATPNPDLPQNLDGSIEDNTVTIIGGNSPSNVPKAFKDANVGGDTWLIGQTDPTGPAPKNPAFQLWAVLSRHKKCVLTLNLAGHAMGDGGIATGPAYSAGITPNSIKPWIAAKITAQLCPRAIIRLCTCQSGARPEEMQKLANLLKRRVQACTGDVGFTSAASEYYHGPNIGNPCKCKGEWKTWEPSVEVLKSED